MIENNKKSLIKSGIILSFMTLASRIMGLLREMTKAAFLGTSGYADAFGIAFMIPNLFRRLFAENSISAAFIPTFRSYIENKDSHKNIQLFVSSCLTLVCFFTFCICAAGMILIPFIIPFFYGQNSSFEIEAETIFLTRIMFPYLFLISSAALFQGILNGCNIFAPSGFTPVLFNVTVIFFTYVLSHMLPNPENIPAEAQAARAMSLGVIAGGFIQAAFQLPFLRKTGWKAVFTSLKKAFNHPGTKKVASLIAPTIIGMAAYQLNDLVSTILANKAGTGTVSSLQYSLRLQELVLGIFAVSIGTVILPDLSGLAQKEKWNEFNEMLIQALKIAALITIPVTFYSLISGKEIISLLYKTKKFDENSVLSTLSVFRFHIAGVFFIALNRIISPAFYAQGNTKLPALAGIICFAFNILFAFCLVPIMKGKGIALALTLASFINTVFLFIFMKKMHSVKILIIVKQVIFYVIKTALFSTVVSVPVYIVRPYFIRFFANQKRIIAYGMPVLLTAILFFALGIIILIIFNDKSIKYFTKKIPLLRLQKR